MDTGLLVAILVVIVLLALLAFFAGRQRRSRQLKDTFGPEYDRTVEQAGDRRAAEADLLDRTERRQQLDCRVAKRNTLLAAATLRAQQHPTDHRNVVVESDDRAARRTTRVWKNHRLFERNTMNDDVEKAADDGAEDSGKNVTKSRGN